MLREPLSFHERNSEDAVTDRVGDPLPHPPVAEEADPHRAGAAEEADPHRAGAGAAEAEAVVLHPSGTRGSLDPFSDVPGR